jgi:predicted enzyme related to lactoylglutathione lyase
MPSQIVWVDIPVLVLERAIRFYSAVLGKAVKKQDYPGMSIGLLPHVEGETSGCLYESKEDRPSDHGPLIYLNAEGRLDQAAAAAESAGGKISQPRHAIGPHGFRVIVRDSEGNRIALHSHN